LGFAAVWAATGDVFVAAMALWMMSVPVLGVAVVVMAGAEAPTDDQPWPPEWDTLSNQPQDRDRQFPSPERVSQQLFSKGLLRARVA
jgi:hypothetical protein